MVPLDDHSTLVDELTRIPLVRKLATAVMTCTPPRVYGVHGDWGAGKTSFLQQLHYALDGMPAREDWVEAEKASHAMMKKRFEAGQQTIKCALPIQHYAADEENGAVVVWFEAWRYQHESAPVVALLHEMRGQLGFLIRAKTWFKKIGEVTLRSSLLHLEQIAKFAWLQSAEGITVPPRAAGIVATIQDQGERWEREHLAEKLPAETMREQLEYAIEQLLGRNKKEKIGEGRRVVVLIDDLDRCEPLATYRLLEGIKIYLNIPNCVFVLGMDQRIIEDAIAESAPGKKSPNNSRKDNSDPARQRAREYLEKLFQEIYYLPIVQDVPEHLLAWLPPDADTNAKAIRLTIKILLDEYHGCIPANPRKIKAFAAVLHRFLKEPDPAQVDAAAFTPLVGPTELAARHPYEALILIMAVLYHFHPEVYRLVEAYNVDFYEVLLRWCRVGVSDAEEHSCFMGLEPAFTRGAVADSGANTLPVINSLYPDYSRGNVLRIQKLINHARLFTKAQIQALLLT